MNKAAVCESLGESHWENLWVKKVPHVSHQGVLWAQEPWLLGMAWEPQLGLTLATEWVLAQDTSFLPISYPDAPDNGNASSCDLLESTERGGAPGVSIAIFQFKPLFFAQNVILEAKMKDRNKGVAASGSGSQCSDMLHMYWSPTVYRVFLIHKMHFMNKEIDIKRIWKRYKQGHTMVSGQRKVEKEVCLL